jgi:hypothetical protein
MKIIQRLILVAGVVACLVACEENSVTQGPRTTRASTTRTSTTTTVEEPTAVEIQTKAGSQDQNSLRHGQPDQPGY